MAPHHDPGGGIGAAGHAAMSRGSALIEVLALGFVAVLLVLQSTVTMGRLQAAGEEVSEAAQAAATHAARHRDAAAAGALAASLAPGAAVEVTLTAGGARAVVSRSVPLVGPESTPVRRTIVGRGTAASSPYLSRPAP